jgi:hypothetical protein
MQYIGEVVEAVVELEEQLVEMVKMDSYLSL